jgi:hypothetical protein
MLSQNNKKAFAEWKAAGRPRISDNLKWQEYKKAKKEFRLAQRKYQKDYDIKNMQELEECQYIDQRFYWFLINRARKVKRKRLQPVKDKVGNIVSDIDEICSTWADHFKCLLCPKQDIKVNESNNLHYQNVSDEIRNASLLNNQGKIFNTPFTKSELCAIVKKMKKRKACGCDQISAEHILFGGEYFHKCLLSLFNGFLKTECIPLQLKKGIIIPIPKGKEDHLLCNNNRGITLLCVFNKMYQQLLMSREDYAVNNSLVETQAAGVSDMSCLHSSLLLKEVVAKNSEIGQKTFVALLDTKKAFDTVWHEGLFYKMLKVDMDCKLWRIVMNLYKKFTCAVPVAGKLSDYFYVTQGVHQGAPMSLWLYKIFVNDLLKELHDEYNMTVFDNNNVPCVAFADDIALIASNHNNLQCMLHTAFQHSVKWLYTYNAKKSEIIIFPQHVNEYTFWLGEENIPIVNKAKHLGIMNYVKNKDESKYIIEKVCEAKRSFIAAKGLGNNCVPLSTTISSKLYWSICVPIVTYGMEISIISNECMNILEDMHWSVAKQIQNLPPQTPNPAVLPQLGWLSIGGHIDYLKLLFIWRILTMGKNCVYKVIVLCRIVEFCNNMESYGPVFNIIKTAKKYGLLDILVESALSSNYMKRIKWKSIVKQSIKEHERKRNYVSSLLYFKLGLYRSTVTYFSMSPWWIHASRYPNERCHVVLIFRIIVGVHVFEKEGNYNGRNKCNVCTNFANDSLQHVLYECEGLSNLREKEMDVITEYCPQPFIQYYTSLSMYEKTCFILNSFGCVTYVEEFHKIFSYFGKFITTMVQNKLQITNTECSANE